MTYLILAHEDQLFSTVNHNPQHLLHYLLPPSSAASQSYDLRHRTELITDLYRIVLDILWIQTLYRNDI